MNGRIREYWTIMVILWFRTKYFLPHPCAFVILMLINWGFLCSVAVFHSSSCTEPEEAPEARRCNFIFSGRIRIHGEYQAEQYQEFLHHCPY